MFLPILFLLTVVSSQIVDNSINLHSNFPRSSSNICNIFDEAAYCQQIVIDSRLSLVAVSHKCNCPEGYRCPSDTDDTKQKVDCDWDETKHWSKCLMRCVPNDV